MDKKRQMEDSDSQINSSNLDISLQRGNPGLSSEPFSWPAFFNSLHQQYATTGEEEKNEKPTLQ